MRNYLRYYVDLLVYPWFQDFDKLEFPDNSRLSIYQTIIFDSFLLRPSFNKILGSGFYVFSFFHIYSLIN